MGHYLKVDDVRIRLAGKVRFTDDPEADGEENKMPLSLLAQLIQEAESQVELDLSPRYAAPFAGISDEPFQKLPGNTQVVLLTLCRLQAVMKVLETDFGSGSASDAGKYFEKQAERYKVIRDQLLEKRENSYNTFKYPPLEGLKLNWNNAAADTGFAGRVITTTATDHPSGGFPQIQINDPSEDFINGNLDDLG